jgi:hypothetical protein
MATPVTEVAGHEHVVNGPVDARQGWDATQWHKAEENVTAAAADLRGITGRGPEEGPQSPKVDASFPQ